MTAARDGLLAPGVGLGWRPETAWLIHERRGWLGFTEVIAESVAVAGPLAPALEQLMRHGVTVIPHGVSLSLGSAEPPDRGRLDRLARVAERLDAPLVSEHVAFVRGGGHETDHLLPVPRTRETLDILVENIELAMSVLPVPLVLENIAALFEWPGEQLDEAAFLDELVARTGVRLLLDVSNLYANSCNHGWDALEYLERIPLASVAYVHAAGGVRARGLYHDTHAHPIAHSSLALLAEVRARLGPVPVLLERDDHFASREQLEAELDAIAQVMGVDRDMDMSRGRDRSERNATAGRDARGRHVA